jgi:hypothetical protein
MPNIEIHGTGDFQTRNEGMQLWKQIFDLIKVGCPELLNEAVVSIFNDICLDKVGLPQPFLRISSSNPAHFEPLKTALSLLHLDIEVSDLKEFIPAKK